MAADSFGWVVADGFRWFRKVLGGFGWFAVLVVTIIFNILKVFSSPFHAKSLKQVVEILENVVLPFFFCCCCCFW